MIAITDIKDVVTFIFTLSGLIIAGMGLATWKKQIKGTKEFETAYNLHYSVLKLRDSIKHVRNRAIWPSESNKALQYAKINLPDGTTIEDKQKSQAYVYEMRWEKIIAASTDIESYLLAAEVLWGSEISHLIKPLNIKISELNIALGQYFNPTLRTKEYMEIHDLIYNKGDGDKNEDVFSKEVNMTIKPIIDYLKQKIS